MVTLEISEHWRVVSGDVDNERPLDRIFSVGTRHGEGILTGLVIGQRGLGLDVQSIGSFNREYPQIYFDRSGYDHEVTHDLFCWFI